MSNKKTIIPLSQKKKLAFVCSGGAAKAGAFHLGVALALEEKGFRFQGGLTPLENEKIQVPNPTQNGKEISVYVGSSAGSIICSFLASGYTLDQIFDSFLGKPKRSGDVKALKKLTYRMMFSMQKETGFLSTLTEISSSFSLPSLRSLAKGLAKESYENLFKFSWMKWAGLFTTSGIEKYMREDVLPANDFRSLSPDLFIVATQLNHSKKVVFGKYNYESKDKTVHYSNETKVSEACAASTALPFIFTPYPIKNEKGNKVYYFDGEIRDTLSTHVAYDAGADLIIASYTHQPYHFMKEIGSLHDHGIPAILIQALYLMIERKIQSSMEMHQRNKAALDATSEFFKENNLSNELRIKCIDLLESKLSHRRGVDFLYIHPKAKDHQMFFGNHFNLSNSKMSDIVRLGFRTAIDCLRRHEFT